MAVGVIIGFLLAAALAAWAAKSLFAHGVSTSIRIFAWACFSASAVAAYLTTHRYSYYANVNTRVYGWPVPTVIFQRHNATAEWEGFLGPTIILALPMNFLLFVLVPSIITIVWVRLLRNRTRPPA